MAVFPSNDYFILLIIINSINYPHEIFVTKERNIYEQISCVRDGKYQIRLEREEIR